VDEAPVVTITDENGKKVAELRPGGKSPGLHRVVWSLIPKAAEVSRPPLETMRPVAGLGTYTVTLRVGAQVLTKRLQIEGVGDTE
jgi:hypothetical protein